MEDKAKLSVRLQESLERMKQLYDENIEDHEKIVS